MNKNDTTTEINSYVSLILSYAPFKDFTHSHIEAKTTGSRTQNCMQYMAYTTPQFSMRLSNSSETLKFLYMIYLIALLFAIRRCCCCSRCCYCCWYLFSKILVMELRRIRLCDVYIAEH